MKSDDDLVDNGVAINLVNGVTIISVLKQNLLLIKRREISGHTRLCDDKVGATLFIDCPTNLRWTFLYKFLCLFMFLTTFTYVTYVTD